MSPRKCDQWISTENTEGKEKMIVKMVKARRKDDIRSSRSQKWNRYEGNDVSFLKWITWPAWPGSSSTQQCHAKSRGRHKRDVPWNTLLMDEYCIHAYKANSKWRRVCRVDKKWRRCFLTWDWWIIFTIFATET